MSTETLFDLDAFSGNSPRMAAIKAADIRTHYAPHMDEPWLAIPMNAAKAALDGRAPKAEQIESVSAIMANFCKLLECLNLLFFGMTENEAVDAALAAMAAKDLQP